MVEQSASKESVLSASHQQLYNSGQHKVHHITHTSRNSLIPKFSSSDLKSIKLKSFSRASRNSVIDERHLADTTYMQKKTYIAPGNIGTCETVTQWNPASNVIMGTNKVQTLRLDQYKDREDIRKTYKCSKINNLDPHDARFENIDKLPLINSKFKNSYKHQIKNTFGRRDHPTEFYSPHKNGNDVNQGAPNSPARSTFHQQEIPAFYAGQPGYRKHLQQVKLDEIHKTKAMVEWKTDMWGQITKPKVFNLPGF